MFSLNVPDTTHLIIAAVASCAIAGVASAVRALSLSGAIAAICVGFVVFGWGGYPGAAALLLFFLTSSALSRAPTDPSYSTSRHLTERPTAGSGQG